MIVIPAIQVVAGRVLHAEAHPGLAPDPAGCAELLLEKGARRVHLINRDAARGIDDPRSRRAVRAAVNVLRDADVAVDVVAGIRSRTGAEFWIESGATTAVLATIAVYRPDIAGEICRAFPGRIMLGLDVKGDVAHSEGWIRDAGDATIHLRRWTPWPAAGVIRTTLDTETRLVGAELEALRRCIQAYPGPLIANGGATSIAHLAQAAAVGAAAVIVDVTAETGLDISDVMRMFPGGDLPARAVPPKGLPR